MKDPTLLLQSRNLNLRRIPKKPSRRKGEYKKISRSKPRILIKSPKKGKYRVSSQGLSLPFTNYGGQVHLYLEGGKKKILYNQENIYKVASNVYYKTIHTKQRPNDYWTFNKINEVISRIIKELNKISNLKVKPISF